MNVDLKNLLAKCNPSLLKAIEAAAGMCLSRSQYEITPEHVLLKLLDTSGGDLGCILTHFEVDTSQLLKHLVEHLESCRTGNTGRPKLSAELVQSLQTGWMVGSIELGHTQIRTGTFFLGYLTSLDSQYGEPFDTLREKIPVSELRKKLSEITSTSSEGRLEESAAAGVGGPGPVPEGEEAIRLYCIDITERARSGALDPIFGREEEIRRIIDILMRRKKNNPILVGEPGVGKTALVEGLAIRIVNGQVPDFLKTTKILSVDLGLLQAGAGVKGEFENRLKAVISGIKSSPDPIISFIDEAHTMIGAGGPAGGSDAANLLKPALARGELRTIAATTWAEYKKYFEKDAALARRFELVRVDEPNEEKACGMLRGLRDKYEATHKVTILDAAVAASVQLSSRYLTGRHLPDKAEGLLDTAAARVKVGQSCEPAALQDVRARISGLKTEIEARQRDAALGSGKSMLELPDLEKQLSLLESEQNAIIKRWEEEKAAIAEISRCREASAKGDPEGAGALTAALRKLESAQGRAPLVPLEVTPDVVAAVVSDWTGVPTGRMVRDEAESILHLEDRIRERIKGQDHAIAAIAKAMRMAKSGVRRPDAPMGVFLFVGPSGVGKTELGKAIADLLFGGEKSVITINMSEYMEKHTVSRLIGSPPGYVGYGEGGVLTEAVRHRPYSVVLLDEVEKAHADVLNIFYQIFDKGVCNDGEGREINFANTIIVMTSNLGLDTIQEMCNQPELPLPEKITEQIRPVLREHFKPALLARFQVVPFYPLGTEMLVQIAKLKLNQIASRLQRSMKIALLYDSEIPELLAERCTATETGARALDHLLEEDILPAISTDILSKMGRGEVPTQVRIRPGSDGGFALEFA